MIILSNLTAKWPMTQTTEQKPDGNFSLNLVVPMYNEGAACHSFFDDVLPIIRNVTDSYEIICVNDGSTDNTLEVLAQYNQQDSRIKIINLTRNFGKEIALTAGIDYSTGDAVIPIDADLQDPPEIIPQLVARWREGYDTVIAVRSDRKSDNYLKRTTANAFYRVIGRISDVPIPANAGDFRLLDRVVVDALKSLPERNRFMKGLYAWTGFKTATVEYSRQQRIAGTSKWQYWHLWNLALEGIFSFTTLPLRIWSYLGLTVAAFSALYGFFIISRTIIYGIDVPGYASLLVTVLFLSGINMIGLGILGEYIGRIFLEVKQRPKYLVRSTLGLDTSEFVKSNRNSGTSTSAVVKDSKPLR